MMKRPVARFPVHDAAWQMSQLVVDGIVNRRAREQQCYLQNDESQRACFVTIEIPHAVPPLFFSLLPSPRNGERGRKTLRILSLSMELQFKFGANRG